MFLKEFYLKYFNQPRGYTVPETLVFAFLFIAAIYLIYRFLIKRMDVDMDERFLVSVVPFVFFGGILRSLGPGDAGFFVGYWFDTPGIYLLVTLVTVASLIASRYLQRKMERPYFHWMLAVGLTLDLFGLYFVAVNGLTNLSAAALILGIFSVIAAALYPVMRYFPRYLDRMGYSAVMGHVMDGSSAFVSVSFFGYTEKHVLPRFLFGVFGPWIMIPLKVGVVWLAVYGINETVEDEKFKNWLKIVIMILGLALGTRNLLSVTMGV